MAVGLAMLPAKLGWIDMTIDDVHEYWRRVFHFSPFTVLFNLTGQPAIVLPLARTLSPSVKLTGDFDNAIASIRIGDCFPFRVFAKNS